MGGGGDLSMFLVLSIVQEPSCDFITTTVKQLNLQVKILVTGCNRMSGLTIIIDNSLLYREQFVISGRNTSVIAMQNTSIDCDLNLNFG